MEKNINIGAFSGNIYKNEGRFYYELQFQTFEVIDHYYGENESFLEKLDELSIDFDDADTWEELIPMILETEKRYNLLDISDDGVSGGSDTYMVFLKDEATLMEYLTFLDELLKDKKRFLKYLKKIEM